jgi:hypothetical protein
MLRLGELLPMLRLGALLPILRLGVLLPMLRLGVERLPMLLLGRDTLLLERELLLP